MTPEQARGMYRRQLRPFGKVTVRRYTSSSEPRNYVDYQALGRVFEAAPDALAGDIKQRNSRAVVLAEDLEAAGLSGPVTASDVLVVRSKVYRIISPDIETRRIGNVAIAYELEVRG
jgi:hypothetical protein